MPSFACFREVQNSRGGMAPLSRGRGAELLTGGRASDTPEGLAHDREGNANLRELASACAKVRDVVARWFVMFRGVLAVGTTRTVSKVSGL